jgi:regulator of protease activity HflC (stomatin/prohibitin superfamily)
VYEFPTHTKTVLWSRDPHEDSKENQEITFNTVEGAKVSSDVSVNYTIRAERVPHIFVRLRGDEAAVLKYLRGKVRDALNMIASHMRVDEVYGAGKEKLLAEATARVKAEVGEDIDIELIGFVGALRVPENIERSINLTIEAQQQAIAAKNKVEQSKAEAEQQVEQARGRADAVLLEATKQAEANLILSKSITPELTQAKAVDKWNGVSPLYSGGGSPIPFFEVRK